tara:strand:+ start:1510 stop:1995 length:486 start_codon:yes stop_codon:yes gene_type:complete
MKKHLFKRKTFLLITSIVIFVDQLTKYLATRMLNENNQITLIPNIINLHLVRNTGAAFSLFSTATTILGTLSLCVTLVLLFLIIRSKSFTLWRGLGLSFLLAGSFGNGLDRWRYGYVNDFIELVPINFPIFNAADIAINIALICFLIESTRKRNNNKINAT